jgi:hypothetical protein
MKTNPHNSKPQSVDEVIKILSQVQESFDLVHVDPRLAFVRSRSNSGVREFGDNPLEYYNENYPELGRTALRMQNSRLYKALQRSGLLEHIPYRGSSSLEPVYTE